MQECRELPARAARRVRTKRFAWRSHARSGARQLELLADRSRARRGAVLAGEHLGHSRLVTGSVEVSFVPEHVRTDSRDLGEHPRAGFFFGERLGLAQEGSSVGRRPSEPGDAAFDEDAVGFVEGKLGDRA